MSPSNKRTRDGTESSFPPAQQPAAKRPRHGLPVDPANLPDGPWKRKLTKVRKELFRQKKVEKQYAKVKARYQRQKQEQNKVAAGDDIHIHPDRQAAIVDKQNTSSKDDAVQAAKERPTATGTSPPLHDATAGDPVNDKGRIPPARPGTRQHGRPVYFQKELAEAEEHKRATAEREAQAKAREEERARKTAERDRLRKAMAKVRKPSAVPGRPGSRVKLGRESGILLDKVKKMVGQKR